MNQYLLSLILLFVTCSGCSETETKIEPIELNTSKLTFTETSGSQYVSITTKASWTVSAGDVSWIEFMPSTGQGSARVQVKVTQNDSGYARTATVTFQAAGGATAALDVLQEIAAPYITIQPESLEALVAGQDVSVTIDANAAWSVQIPAQDQPWISLKSKTETNAVFEVKENETENNRTSSIVFRLNEHEVQATFNLLQKSAENATAIGINPQSTGMPDNGGNVTVNVSTGVEWEINISTTDTWVTLKEKSGNQAILDVAENLTGVIRTSNVIFSTKDGSASATFVITQEKGYSLSSAFTIPASLEGKNYTTIHNTARNYGFDYSEHPHCTGGYGGHTDGIHLVTEHDTQLDKPVFRFDIHITPVIDGERCSSSTTDRQRNELKTVSNNSTWAKVQGNWDEWQILEWKMKIPVGFQPTSSFCHIHQIKAVDGNNDSSPIITITPRSNSDGSNKRMQLIHSVDGGTGKALGTFVDNIPLSLFEGEWVQVREVIHYTHSGYYACKITRISDGMELINVEKNNIDMWRKGSSYIRSKYGIYRSLAGGDLSKNPVGQSSLLKNESIWMCDFKVYEKNANPNPGQAHD